jgi:hypothetical protein
MHTRRRPLLLCSLKKLRMRARHTYSSTVVRVAPSTSTSRAVQQAGWHGMAWHGMAWHGRGGWLRSRSSLARSFRANRSICMAPEEREWAVVPPFGSLPCHLIGRIPRMLELSILPGLSNSQLASLLPTNSDRSQAARRIPRIGFLPTTSRLVQGSWLWLSSQARVLIPS